MLPAMAPPPAGLVVVDRGEAGREQAREALRTIRTASRQVLEDLQTTVATLRGNRVRTARCVVSASSLR
jgi:hypothetical protein